MNRRDALIALAVPALPRAVFAQSPKALTRVAILFFGTPESEKDVRDAFARGLKKHGHADGKDLIVEERFAAGHNDRIPQVVAEMVARKPAVLVVGGSQAVLAAKAATSTIPIVMGSVGDPVGQKIVASLAHPGGNITGNALLSEDLVRKRLEILKEMLPAAVRVGYLVNPENAFLRDSERSLDAAAKKLGVTLTRFNASNEAELRAVLAAIDRTRLDAVMGSGDIVGRLYRKTISDALNAKRIPGIHAFSEAVEEGALASFAVNIPELVVNAAWFVHRLLMGARPGDLPIEQPTEFELAVNLKTARALGVRIPQSVLVRADRAVE